MRLSPIDAKLLRWPEQPKLKGVAYGHFGAFFERERRENDYLAGRLDGAERLVKLVLGDEDSEAFRRWAARAFLAILHEEQPALETVGGLISELRERVRKI